MEEFFKIYNPHICKIHPPNAYNSVVLGIFIRLYSHHHFKIPEYFFHSKNTKPISNLSPFLSSQPQTTINQSIFYLYESAYG